jgi:hypothetical protein
MKKSSQKIMGFLLAGALLTLSSNAAGRYIGIDVHINTDAGNWQPRTYLTFRKDAPEHRKIPFEDLAADPVKATWRSVYWRRYGEIRRTITTPSTLTPVGRGLEKDSVADELVLRRATRNISNLYGLNPTPITFP